MPFPESKRVIYAKNPLEKVICQLRFPPILKIDTVAPAEFQERIRKSYPILRERVEAPVVIPQEIVQQMPGGAPNSLFGVSNRIYDFASVNGQWTTSLAKDFIALTSEKYERWELFREQLEASFNALSEEYSPLFFTRIGLRYRNIIRKSALDIENVEWSELLQSYIAGELASPEKDIKDAIKGTLHNVLINLENQSQVRIVHGLVHDEDKNEDCYLIDSDFFTNERTEANDVLSTLNHFNRQNGHLFRWCITDRLHNAMEPNLITN
jgi:uncharacterized protein (TIGR04255 family)